MAEGRAAAGLVVVWPVALVDQAVREVLREDSPVESLVEQAALADPVDLLTLLARSHHHLPPITQGIVLTVARTT